MNINWKNERVFISGGAGVIGSCLIEKLLAKGAKILTGDLKQCPESWKGRVQFYHGDLNHLLAKTLFDFFPTVTFHLAATFERSLESYPFWQENFHHNIKLSHYLMTLLKDCQSLKRYVFASSYLVYNPKNYLSIRPRKKAVSLSESASLSPRNLCGMAKLMHEKELQFLESFCKHRWSFANARIFRGYGKGSCDIISRWITAALKKEPLQLYQPENQFDYIFAKDSAEGLLRLAENPLAFGTYNLGSGQSTPVFAIIDLLKEHFPHLRVQKIKSQDLYEASQADMTQFFNVTGWKPTYTLKTALLEMIPFLSNNLKSLC